MQRVHPLLPPTRSNQIVILLRHGERVDSVAEPTPDNSSSWEPGDPPLTTPGIVAAGIPLAKQLIAALPTYFTEDAAIVMVTSPFTRTLQTALSLRRGLQDSFNDGEEGRSTCAKPQIPLSVDWRLGEVYGPQRVKTPTGKAPVLPSPQNVASGWLQNHELLGDITPSGHHPRWGEDIPAAHRRYAATLEGYVNFFETSSFSTENSKSNSQPKVLLLVTHGDALQASLSAVYPNRCLYENQFLAFLAFTPRKSSSAVLSSSLRNWRLKSHNGVQWLCEDGAQDSGTESDGREEKTNTTILTSTSSVTEHSQQLSKLLTPSNSSGKLLSSKPSRTEEAVAVKPALLNDVAGVNIPTSPSSVNSHSFPATVSHRAPRRMFGVRAIIAASPAVAHGLAFEVFKRLNDPIVPISLVVSSVAVQLCGPFVPWFFMKCVQGRPPFTSAPLANLSRFRRQSAVKNREAEDVDHRSNECSYCNEEEGNGINERVGLLKRKVSGSPASPLVDVQQRNESDEHTSAPEDAMNSSKASSKSVPRTDERRLPVLILILRALVRLLVTLILFCPLSLCLLAITSHKTEHLTKALFGKGTWSSVAWILELIIFVMADILRALSTAPELALA